MSSLNRYGTDWLSPEAARIASRYCSVTRRCRRRVSGDAARARTSTGRENDVTENLTPAPPRSILNATSPLSGWPGSVP